MPQHVNVKIKRPEQKRIPSPVPGRRKAAMNREALAALFGRTPRIRQRIRTGKPGSG